MTATQTERLEAVLASPEFFAYRDACQAYAKADTIASLDTTTDTLERTKQALYNSFGRYVWLMQAADRAAIGPRTISRWTFGPIA